MTTLAQTKPGAIDLNDLVYLEETYGSLDEVDFSRMRVIRDVLWLVVRKSEPDILREQVGARFDANTMKSETARVLRAAGLIAEGEDAEGNDEPATAG